MVVRMTLGVVLLLAVCVGLGTVRTERVAGALPDWSPYIDAAKTVALALTTVDYRTVDRDVQRILDNATGVFYDNFKSRSAEFTQVVRDAQSTSTGIITEANLQSHDDGAARVLVVVNTTTINAGVPNPDSRVWRLVITVQKVGESYKASTVEFLR
jgi:hypothetical protein